MNMLVDMHDSKYRKLLQAETAMERDQLIGEVKIMLEVYQTLKDWDKERNKNA